METIIVFWFLDYQFDAYPRNLKNLKRNLEKNNLIFTATYCKSESNGLTLSGSNFSLKNHSCKL